MIAGVRNPHQLAALAHRGIKASPKELYDALHGRLTDHHRFLLQLHLAQWDAADASIQHIDREVDGRIERMDAAEEDGQVPFRAADPAAVLDPRCQCPLGDDHPRRDRPRHEPLPDRRSSGRLGRAVPRPERECRQAEVLAPAQGRALAEDHAGAMRMGGQTPEEQLLRGAVPSAERPARPAEGDLRRRRLHSYRCLSHAERRHVASGSRRRLLRSPLARKPKPGVWSPSSPGSASRCNSNRSPKPPDGRAKLSPERWPDRRNPSLTCGRFLVRSEATRQSPSQCATGWRLLRSARNDTSRREELLTRSPDCPERSPGTPDYGSMADQNDRSLASVGDNRLPFVLGCSRPATPRPISLDPLLTEMRSLRGR